MRLLLSLAASGPWNMAVDEALLEAVGASAAEGAKIDDSQAVWRFYEWTPATLSLGYFQAAADRAAHPPSRACPLVRRLSGGGAILHDRELTYSFIVPTSHPLGRDTEDLYLAVHGVLIEVLARWGVEAHINRTAVEHPPGREPFLCFARRAVGDVLVGPHKIAGSAQRRRRGAVLQHGSVLLRRSSWAPELPGLSELGVSIEPVELATAWRSALASRWGISWQTDELTPAEHVRATALKIEKFEQMAWNERR